jgi:hypothetical protein
MKKNMKTLGEVRSILAQHKKELAEVGLHPYDWTDKVRRAWRRGISLSS